jgi:DNA-directed RNA polymerase specialized sigma24 family protein
MGPVKVESQDVTQLLINWREGDEDRPGQLIPTNGAVALVALDDALESFARTYPRKCEVVELKFFGGLDTKKISEVLQVSEKTILRDWNFAKLWLFRALSDAA